MRFDLVWIDGGAELSPGFYRWLKRSGMRVINYCCDDPFGGRDGHKWNMYLRSLRYHDLTVVMRTTNLAEARKHQARQVARVFMSYDPVAHAPVKMNSEERLSWSSEVVFVGSWMPERGPFMARLLEEGIPLSIWGNSWHEAPEWERLRSAVRGPAVWGADYVKPLQCAKVALGLLSKGNRDLHTQRSAEVPYIGGAIFCAERTTEHSDMYCDGEQALFWSSPEECARACRMILADTVRRDRMAAAARERVQQLGLSNDTMMDWILNQIETARTMSVYSLSGELNISR